MVPVLESSVNVGESQQVTPRLFLIGIFSVFYLVSALLGPINVFDGELVDTDSYTRLNRVLFVLEQGHWNDSIYPRSNAPYGESIHWTKPMDLVLLTGGSLLALVMPFSTGLHFWGVVISPVLYVVAFMGIFYLMRESLDRLGMILLTIVFLLQPILASYFMIGRPDHHSLILAVFCWFLAGLYKWSAHTLHWRHFFFIGGMGAVGLWVSVEFLVPIGLFLVVFAVLWIWQGDRNAFPISGIMSAMFLVSACCLLIERFPDDLLLIEYDKISLPYCVLLGLIALVWLGINALGPHSSWTATIWRRLLVVGVMGFTAGVVQWSLFPDFFKGPLAEMDPTIGQLLWDNAAETQPLQPSEAIMNLGMGILVLPCLAYSMRRDSILTSKYQGILLLVGVSVFVPLAIFESRWTPYASIMLLIPYVAIVRRVLEWIGSRWLGPSGEAGSLIMGLVLLFWPFTIGTVMAFDEPKLELSTVDGNCPIKTLSKYLTTDEPWTGTTQTILAFQDFSPELLYRTPHNVIGTPMHRNQDGVKDMYMFMTATDFDLPYTIVQRRHINLVAVCVQSKAEFQFFNKTSDKTRVHEYLTNGIVPSWLSEVQLPEDLIDSFRLFQVMYTKHESRLTE